LAAGCAYHSEYLAPLDGRPRAVWAENHVVMDPAGFDISPSCAALLAWVSPSSRLHLIDGDDQIDGDPAPRVALAVALEVNRAHRFWVPRPSSRAAAPRVPSSSASRSLTPPDVSRPAPPSHGTGHASGHGSTTSSHGHGSGSGSSGADSLGFLNPAGLVAALVIVAGITLVALPPLTFGLANSRPENSRANAEAIDQVNALNDWLRSANSACAMGDAS
jgi:hypothetical protein